MRHLLLYPIFLIGYLFVIFLASRNFFELGAMLDLLELIHFLEIIIVIHLIYVLFFTRNNNIKLICFAFVVLLIVVIHLTISALNPF